MGWWGVRKGLWVGEVEKELKEPKSFKYALSLSKL